jgi:hypothetical protein
MKQRRMRDTALGDWRDSNNTFYHVPLALAELGIEKSSSQDHDGIRRPIPVMAFAEDDMQLISETRDIRPNTTWDYWI